LSYRPDVLWIMLTTQPWVNCSRQLPVTITGKGGARYAAMARSAWKLSTTPIRQCAGISIDHLRPGDISMRSRVPLQHDKISRRLSESDATRNYQRQRRNDGAGDLRDRRSAICLGDCGKCSGHFRARHVSNNRVGAIVRCAGSIQRGESGARGSLPSMQCVF